MVFCESFGISFPDGAAEYARILAGLGVLSIVYGGLNALAQSDIKKMIAYSSVSHMGFVLLGVASLTAEGVNGAIYQMVSHGVLSAMLFLMAGVLYDRTHDRRIDSYRGLMQPMPQYTILTAIAFFASLGLPGFSGFVGELFTLMGGFQSAVAARLAYGSGDDGYSTGGCLLSVDPPAHVFWYLTWSRHRTGTSILTDLTFREKALLIPLGAMALGLGFFPNLIFNLSGATVAQWLVKFAVE